MKHFLFFTFCACLSVLIASGAENDTLIQKRTATAFEMVTVADPNADQFLQWDDANSTYIWATPAGASLTEAALPATPGTLAAGNHYDDTVTSGAYTVTSLGTGNEGDQIKISLLVNTADLTITWPASTVYRAGVSGAISTTFHAIGTHVLALNYQEGVWMLADSGVDKETGIYLADGTTAEVPTFDNTAAGLKSALQAADVTGSGDLVFAESPTLVTPALGTPTALVLTSATGLPAAGIADGDHGDFTYTSGVANLDADVVGAAEIDSTATPTLAQLTLTGSLIGATVDSTGDFDVDLGDAAGVNAFTVRDSASADILSIDSEGGITWGSAAFDGAAFALAAGSGQFYEFVMSEAAGGTGFVIRNSAAGLVFRVLSDGTINSSHTCAGAWDFGGGTSLEIPNGATPTTDAAGEIALDTNALSGTTGQGLIRYDDGLDPDDTIWLVGTTNAPSDDYIPKYNDTTGTISWEVDAGEPAQTQTLTNKTIDSGSNTIQIHDEEHTGAGPHTLTASDCYGGVHYVTAASEVDLPAVADGMHLTIISEIAGTVTIDPNGTEVIKLDGTAASAGEAIDSPGAVGDICVLTYRASGTWYAATNSWTEDVP